MRRTYMIAGLVSLMVAPAGARPDARQSGRPDAVQDARQAIAARYRQFDRAYVSKDFATVASMFAPKCRLTLSEEHRSMLATRAVQGMRMMSRALTVTNARTRLTSVKPAGQDYEVVAAWTADSRYAPPSGPTPEDPARRGRVSQTFHDLWRKTDKGWQIARRVID